LATPDDAETIHRFIVGLAIYEREPDAVQTTPATLREQLLSERPPFECLLAEVEGEPRGFALFFHNYSTWRGRPGLYLEDLFVPEEHRGTGLGKRMLVELARLALQRGCSRLEWIVLDWNRPSIQFYEALGATVRRDWLPCRLDGDALRDLAEGDGSCTPAS
jgi:GNAT superfamily N-acetyltransferase